MRALPVAAAVAVRGPAPDELALAQSLKQRELRVRAGHTLMHEGQTDALFHTLLDG